MNILSKAKKATQIKYLLTMDWAAFDNGHDCDFLLFDSEDDAIKEYNAQLAKLKHGSTWESDALKTAIDEHSDYDEENEEPEYYYGEYDYTNSYKARIQDTLDHPDKGTIIKSFSIYANGYESEMHTYLTLFAIGTIGGC